MTKKNVKKSFKITCFLKKTKKKIFRKTGLPAKPEYPKNRATSETFFPDSSLKLNSLQAYLKKNSKNVFVADSQRRHSCLPLS